MYKRITFVAFLLAAIWMIPFAGSAVAQTLDSTFHAEFVLVNETGKTIRDIYWANDSYGLYDAKGMLAAPLPTRRGCASSMICHATRARTNTAAFGRWGRFSRTEAPRPAEISTSAPSAG